MITTKKDLKECLNLEENLYRGDTDKLRWKLLQIIPFTILESVTLYRYVTLLRKTEYHLNVGNTFRFIWYKTRLRHMQYKYGLSIPINVFGKGLRIRHLAQTRVSAESRIGENCTIYPFVSIGTNQDQSPCLGNNINVYSGARIIGGITLANNISVAANAVVTKSCNIEGAVLAGVPAKIIKTENS